jgi:HEAT repeat protein
MKKQMKYMKIPNNLRNVRDAALISAALLFAPSLSAAQGAPPAPPSPPVAPAAPAPPAPPVPPIPPIGVWPELPPFPLDLDLQIDWADVSVEVDQALDRANRELQKLNIELGDLNIDLGKVHVELPPLPPLPPVAMARVQPPQPPQRPNPDPDRNARRSQELYEQAQNAINQERYERAIEQLDRLIGQYDGQSIAVAVANRVDGALYWKAYTQIKQKQIADALGTVDVMLKKFPTSRWLKDAKALEVQARQASGQSVSPDAQADEEIKLLALRGLMQSDPDRGVPMIEQLLAGNSSVKVKENALFVLSQSRSSRAREIIAGVAKGGSNPDLQLRAVRYLGAIGGPENRQILEEVYKSTTDISVKRSVIRSFVPSGDRARLASIARSETSPELRSEAIRQLGAMRAVTELSELYQRETNPDIKRSIIQSLMVSQATDRLVEIAKTEKDDTLRRSAARNLGVMNVEKTGDLLRSLYNAESNLDVKREIISALGNQRNATALVELARAEKNVELRKAIVSRLSNMRDKVAMDYMLEILK